MSCSTWCKECFGGNLLNCQRNLRTLFGTVKISSAPKCWMDGWMDGLFWIGLFWKNNPIKKVVLEKQSNQKSWKNLEIIYTPTCSQGISSTSTSTDSSKDVPQAASNLLPSITGRLPCRAERTFTVSISTFLKRSTMPTIVCFSQSCGLLRFCAHC